jgi:hypothetical protein
MASLQITFTDMNLRLREYVIAQGIELEFDESIAPAMGVSYGGKIVLLPGLSNAEAFLNSCARYVVNAV